MFLPYIQWVRQSLGSNSTQKKWSRQICILQILLNGDGVVTLET